MGKGYHKLDKFELELISRGYEIAGAKILSEETDLLNPGRIYTNIKPIYSTIRKLGFSEDTIIRIRLTDDKYLATIFTRKDNP